MPIVPIPTTVWDLFWLTYRTLMQITFVIAIIIGLRIVARHTKMVRTLLSVVQSREQMLADLKVTAAELARKTDAVVAASKERDEELRRSVQENTDITRAAATAAKDAFHAANDVNQKIASTNEKIERVLKPADPVSEHLAQIDRNTAAIADNTKPKG
jgi:hypothetical protein